MKFFTFFLIYTFLFLFTLPAQTQVPDWQWANEMGGNDYDFGRTLVLDKQGNTYAVGDFKSLVDFDPSVAVSELSASGIQDVYIAKYDPLGNYIWAKQLSGLNGSGALNGFGVTLDTVGNIYICGKFSGEVDFDPGASNFILNSIGMGDVFVCKLTSMGNFIWAKQMGGTNDESAYAIAVDNSGNSVITGYFSGTADFDPGIGNAVLSGTSNTVFICKLNNSGNYLWAKAFDGSAANEGNCIALDADGNVYSTGFFIGTSDFDPNSGVENLSSQSLNFRDIYISKLDSSGNYIWAKSFGGAGNDVGMCLKVSSLGEIYVSGYFFGVADFDPDLAIYQLASSGSNDAFIAKFTGSGDFTWAQKLGGPSADVGTSIALDTRGDIYFCGQYYQNLFFDSIAAGANQLVAKGGMDVFVSKLNNNGNFLWAKSIGGTNHDAVNAIEVDAATGVYVSGNSISTSMQFDLLTTNSSYPGVNQSDIFIAKLGCATSSTLNVIACSNYLSPSGNYLYTASGTYIDTLANFFGCDSLITLQLVISNSVYNSQTISSCNSFLSPSGKYTWTASGTYLDTLQSSTGCDSIISVQLTINTVTYSTQILSACNSFTSPSGKYTWQSSGTYFDTIPNSAGCDSSISIQLTILESSNSLQFISACNSFVSPSGIYTWTNSGTYYDTITNVLGCDSILEIELTLDSSSSSQQSITACGSYTSQSGNYTWLTSGIYNDTVPTSNGCFNIFVIDLTIETNSASNQTITACNSYLSPSENYIWTSSGIYLDTIANAAGCDSVITTNLSITNGGSSFQTIRACNNYISPSGNFNWTNSGVYTDAISLGAGCDSIITIDLTIYPHSYISQTINACNSYTSPSGLYTWTASGSYLDTLVNSNGCDSIITTELTIGSGGGTSEQFISSCNSYTSSGNTVSWTTSGIYQDTLLSSSGCDSILTIHLTILNSSSSIQSVETCNSYLSPSGKYNWTNTGTYIDTITNAAGCDSILTIQLSIGNNSSFLQQSACDSLMINGEPFYSSGIYTQMFLNSAGCDSTLTLDITVYQDYKITLNEFACDSFLWFNQSYTSSGIYTQNYFSVNGCDSIIELDLTINTSSDSTLFITACDNFELNGTVYSFDGIYTQTLTNTLGCDSTLLLNLTLLNGSSSQISQSSCDSVVWNNQTYTSSGIYVQNLTTSAGCDSTLILDLTINTSSIQTLTQTVCDSLVWNSQTYTASGYYTQGLTSVSGCDSLVHLFLTVNSSSENYLTDTACTDFTLNGVIYTASGIYVQNLVNNAGCDSLLTLNLTLQSSSSSISQVACDSILINSIWYTASGTYQQILVNAAGCDSSINLNLSITQLDTSVIQNSNSLISNAIGANFQWIDCTTGQAIVGATTNVFTATSNGSYAVTISKDSCNAVSSCYSILSIGLPMNEESKNTLTIYPNPASEITTIYSSQAAIEKVELYSILGEKLHSWNSNSNHEYTQVIDCSIYPAGVYFIKVLRSNRLTLQKLVLKK